MRKDLDFRSNIYLNSKLFSFSKVFILQKIIFEKLTIEKQKGCPNIIRRLNRGLKKMGF